MTDFPAISSHNNLHAALFCASSAEQYVLCVQAYRLARLAVLSRLDSRSFENPAVVLDLDETVLDNSPYQAWLIHTGRNYSDATWNRWCNASEAPAIPGSLAFLRFLRSRGVQPLFITSRVEATRQGTVKNLAALGALTEAEIHAEVPSSTEHLSRRTRLFMKGMALESPGGGSSPTDKYSQRVFCEQQRQYEIVLSVGDNLSDYAEYYGRVFDEAGQVVSKKHPTASSRMASATQDSQLFGRDFVLIPNPSYGGWLRALESNGLASGDEAGSSPDPVRGALDSPKIKAFPRIWNG